MLVILEQWHMDFQTISLLAVAALLALTLLVLAGVVLPTRSYSQLLSLVERIVEVTSNQAQAQEARAVATSIEVAGLRTTIAAMQAASTVAATATGNGAVHGTI
jgi:hypothetical protein